jgi:dTDP-4-dehydrorhamnose reductase
MSRRALIFGSSGQLGLELGRELRARGWEVKGYERVHLDITDAARVEQAVAEFDPQAVFNSAAYNQVDVAEKEPAAAYGANALGVRNLALACRQADAHLIHYSTDYVFDGTAGRPYEETDATHPLGAYAVSKLSGELYAQAYLERPLIVRTSGVFGPGGLRTNRGNFLELMLRMASSGKEIRVVEDHVASPTYAPWLAGRTIDLVERGESGVFHIGGGTPISWFEYARMIFRLAGVNPELHATTEREYRTAARRPKFSALANTRLAAVGVAPMPPLEDAVKDYLQRREAIIAEGRE